MSQPVKSSALWLASHASTVDKSRCSRSAEVGDIWLIYDEQLQYVRASDSLALVMSMGLRETWSTAGENSLVMAHELAGGPMPSRGLVLGRGTAKFMGVSFDGANVGRFRREIAWPAGAAEVHLFRDFSIAPVLILKRRLRVVADLLRRSGENGFTVSRGLELDAQWRSILRDGPVGPAAWDHLVAVDGVINEISEFCLLFQLWTSLGDFMIGCPLAAVALVGVGLMVAAGFNLFFLSFESSRWSAIVCQAVKFTALWPASWVAAVDKSRSSKPAEVGEVWRIYDERLQCVQACDVLAIEGGDVHGAWDAWSAAAENALASAFVMAGGQCAFQGSGPG